MNRSTANAHRWLRTPTAALMLAAVILGAGATRIVGLDRLLVWHDEVFTLVRVFGYSHIEVQRAIFSAQLLEPSDLLRFQRPDPGHGWADALAAFKEHPEHAPLYYVLGRLAAALPTDPVSSLRGISAVFGILLIPAAFWLMRELFGKGPAPWVSASLVACSPLQFLYAQEARQYALWTLLVVAASAVLQRALRRDRASDWWLYGILTGLGLYAHLLFAAMIPIHALYGFLARPDDRARFALQARCWAAAVSAALIGFIPWLLVLATGADALGQNTEWMKRPIGPERVATTWAEHLVRMFVDLNPGNVGWWALLMLPIGWALVRFFRRAPRPAAWMLMLTALVYIGIVLGPDLLLGGSRSQHVRYALPGVLAAQLMVAWTLGSAIEASGSGTRSLATGGLVAALGLGGLSIITIQRSDSWWNKSFSSGNAEVAEILNAGERPLVIASDFGVGPGELISLAYRLDERVRVWGERAGIPNVLPSGFGETVALMPSIELRALIEPDRDLVAAAGTWQWFRAKPRASRAGGPPAGAAP